jgi:hypothetical protein
MRLENTGESRQYGVVWGVGAVSGRSRGGCAAFQHWVHAWPTVCVYKYSQPVVVSMGGRPCTVQPRHAHASLSPRPSPRSNDLVAGSLHCRMSVNNATRGLGRRAKAKGSRRSRRAGNDMKADGVTQGLQREAGGGRSIAPGSWRWRCQKLQLGSRLTEASTRLCLKHNGHPKDGPC